MPERIVRVTESSITVAILAAVGFFALGFVSGQHIERRQSYEYIEQARQHGFQVGAHDYGAQPKAR